MVSYMAIDQEIRDHILSFLDRTEDFDEFEAWFIGATWDDRTRLVADVDHLLVERPELDELRWQLLDLISTVVIGEPAQRETGTSSETVFGDLEYREVTAARTIRRDLAIAGR